MNIYTYIRSQSEKLKTGRDRFDVLNQSVPLLIGIFIFLNPFPHITTIKEVCFYLSTFLVTVFVLLRKSEFSIRTPLSLPFLLFVSWALLTTFFALDKENSIHDIYSHLLKYLILYYLILNSFTSKDGLHRLSWLIVLSSSLFSLGVLFYDYFVLGNRVTTRFGLAFVQTPTNLLGIITLFGIILGLYLLLTESRLSRKTVLLFCLLPLLAVTFLTQTRSNVIALAAALMLLFPIRKKAVLVLLGISLVLTAMTHHTYRWHLGHLLNNERLGLNHITYEVLKDYPVTGIGFGMLTYGDKVDLEAYKQRVSDGHKPIYALDYPHNMFLSIAVRVGVVGLLLFLYILFMCFKMCFEIVRKGKDTYIRKWGFCVLSSLVMFLIKGCFEPVLTHLTEVVLYTIFAMISILWRLNRASAT